MRTRLSMGIALFAASIAGPGLAAHAPAPATQEGVDVRVVTDSGRHLPQFPVKHNVAEGDYRAYLQAQAGSNYSLLISNRSDRRVGVVIAVDGRNIISGMRSDLAPEERMYVLGPRETASYTGWRTAKDRVNRFFFSHWEDSYAEAFGDRSAMGVIAVAVFPEKARRHTPLRLRQGVAGPPLGAYRHGPDQEKADPGTGFGEEATSPSRSVLFEAESQPSARYFIKYEWRETLCDMGIVNCRKHRNRFWPHQARYGDEEEFAPPPPRRRH